ncbi:hypothetical protein BC342_34890 [Streptomyces olivaceus]|nr:hypothetical protein BC342_34890 [Streptomyces olivaceus]
MVAGAAKGRAGLPSGRAVADGVICRIRATVSAPTQSSTAVESVESVDRGRRRGLARASLRAGLQESPGAGRDANGQEALDTGVAPGGLCHAAGVLCQRGGRVGVEQDAPKRARRWGGQLL